MKQITLNKKIFLTIAGIVVFLLLILIGFKAGKKTRIAFYGLSQQQSEAIQKELNGKKLVFVQLNYSRPLVEQMKKIDLVICPMGKNSKACADEIFKKKNTKTFTDSKILAGSSVSASNAAGTTGGKISQIPILFDVNEILIDKRTAGRTSTKELSTWNQVETFLENSKKGNYTSSPLTFAGKDTEVYLGIISSLLESFEGAETYKMVAEKISSTKRAKYKELIQELAADREAPLYETTRRLASWRKENYINSETYKLSDKDIDSFMTYHDAALVFMPLSHHRNIDPRTIQRFETIPVFSGEAHPYYPSARPLAKRACVSSIYCAIPLSSKKQVKNLIHHLTKESTQENLCSATGLAPLSARCKTPDIQSDDARFWIAASSTPVINLSESAFDNEKSRTVFAKELQEFIANIQIK